MDLRFRTFLFFGFLLFGVSACTVQEDPLSVLNIDTGLSIELSQQLGSNGGIPTIDIWTTEQVECSNAIIRNQTSGNGITILGFGFDGGVCILGNSQPRAQLPLSSEPDNQTFDIIFAGAGKLPGSVEKSGESFALSLASKKGINSRNNTIHRITEGMVWGYVELPNDTMQLNVMNNYLNQIANNLSIRSYVFENGDYSQFKILNNKISLPSILPNGNFIPFAFKVYPGKLNYFIDALKNIPGAKGRINLYDGSFVIW